ncbi:conserved Plasmodium protein, unknown function [Plasmodium vivax]|uniref:Heptatricopeptide repeat-containing protein n=2 Tax=Plasmodium vivax TaxID=5855 RepID=A0A564ZXH7_PLAVI|nr:conserved Plasmodium protein, unknown function [Plasmodium vivax]
MHFRLLCATLGVCGAARSAALSTEPLQSCLHRGSLFIRRSPRKYEKKVAKKRESKVTSCRGEDTHKRSSRSAAVISTLECPIVGVPVGFPLHTAQHGEHRVENNGGRTFLSPIIGNRKKVTLSLRKEIGQRHFNSTKLNNLLCMQFLPDVSNAYLRYVLEKFSANDLPVKENVLFHLTLRYLRERTTTSVGGKTSERDSQLINSIENNSYKFIADHARVLKKCAKGKKQKEANFGHCRTEGRAEEGNHLPPSQNKTIDAYLKMKKKFNIIFVSIKSERNIYRVFRKIKRNISFYDFQERLAILCFFHRHAQHRFALDFFKKYIFSLKNENNLFVLHLVSSLGESTLLKRYMLVPHLTYHAILSTPEGGGGSCGDTFKWSFLPINACNYVESYMKERFFLGGASGRGGPRVDRPHTEATFLIYAKLLDSLAQKRNCYFPELFLKQFCLYYSEQKEIPHDGKWHYFLITVSALMKAHYVRGRLQVRGKPYVSAAAHEGVSRSLANRPLANCSLANRVTIHDDDIFRDKTHCLAIRGGNRLNSQVVAYLLGAPPRGDALKQYSLLLLLQYAFLLKLNLEHVNLVSRNSPNHFSNGVDRIESSVKEMAKQISGTEPTFLEKQATPPEQREDLLTRITFLYESILSSHCNHTGESILLYNYTFQELTAFVGNYLTDVMETSFHGVGEVAEEMNVFAKHILPLCRVNPRLFFILMEALKEGSNPHMARHLWLGSQHMLRNLRPWVREAIAGELLGGGSEGGGSQGETHQGDTHQGEAHNRGDPPLARTISAYDSVQNTYQQITSCYDKAQIKRLLKGLLTARMQTKGDPSPLGVFKRPILALNLKQIFFLFVTLNYFNLHCEVVRLFRHVMGEAAFRKSFCRAVLRRGKHPPLEEHPSVEEHKLRQKILYLYCNSSFCVDSPLRLPAGVTCSRGLMKHVLFYRDPLHMFNHLMGKYAGGAAAGGSIKGAAKSKAAMEEILQKMESSKFFREESLSKFRSSNIYKQFFSEGIYTRVSQTEYTLIFYQLMRHLYKQGSTWHTGGGENRAKQSESNSTESSWQVEFVYLHFYAAWQSYLKVHKMSKINFLICAKTFLLVNDMGSFQNLLCTNKRMAEKQAIFVNSLLNNYLHHCGGYLHTVKNNFIAPADMYITRGGELIIFNLNHEQLVQRIPHFGEYHGQCKVTLFIDYRKLFPDLINLQFYMTLPFLQSPKVKSFLEENKITLCEENFWSVTDMVIFYGKCLDKRDKIVEFFSKQMSDFRIQRNNLIKDAFVVSRKG